jgi:2,4-dienoyl-CoA reductase (NADPH2)
MCQYQAREGYVTPWHFVHLGARAQGGASLVMVEASSVSPEGRLSMGDVGLWEDGQGKALLPLVNLVHSLGSKVGIQLAHGGRKASCHRPWEEGGRPLLKDSGSWPLIAPSPVAFSEGYQTPLEMNSSEMERIMEAFVHSAIRAKEADFDVLELHLAHGYLLHEFLSPLSNKRSDQWGKSLEGRMSYPLEVVRRVREVWPPERPFFVRISATDWVPDGWSIEDSVILSRKLKGLGVDLIDVSSGGIIPHAIIPVGPLYQVGLSERIKNEVNIPTGAVGLVTDPEEAESIIKSGKGDAVLIGRAMLRNPNWPLEAALKLNAFLSPHESYLRAWPARQTV